MADTDKSIYEEVSAQLEQYGLGSLTGLLTSLITEYGSEMKETIKAKLRESEAYKQRFAGNEARRAAGLAVLDEATYLYNESAYNETLRGYNMGDLATTANYARFIGGDVSPVELQKRFSMAVDKVKKADPALKAQLRLMYPGISDDDLSRSLLFGKDGADFLKTRVGQAEILAEASTAGITLQTTAADLEAQGVTRADAAKGLSRISMQKSGLQQAQTMFGGNLTPDEIQKDLESENLLGQVSKRNKRLASQARSEFTGSSGMGQGSLKRSNSQI
jgi:hypothetical protein